MIDAKLTLLLFMFLLLASNTIKYGEYRDIFFMFKHNPTKTHSCHNIYTI
jgi:hypothetical protein